MPGIQRKNSRLVNKFVVTFLRTNCMKKSFSYSGATLGKTYPGTLESLVLKYHLLTESEVITGKSQTSALMYWSSESEVNTSRPRSIWDSPCNDRTDGAFLKKNTIKTPEVIFHIRLRALWLSSSLILKRYRYACFSFSYWKHSCTVFISFLIFAHELVALIHNSKEPSRREQFS